VLSGGVAQLGERLLCKQDVIGSIPFTSTTDLWVWVVWLRAKEFNGQYLMGERLSFIEYCALGF
jgi:hypothetical protein